RHPRIRFIGQAGVARLEHSEAGWQAWNTQGQPLASTKAAITIIAAGAGSAPWLPAHWPLLPVRGQVSWGKRNAATAMALPPFPVNGAGNLVPDVPFSTPSGWVMGSTFERGQTQLPAPAAQQAAAHAHNLGKLAQLLPASAALLAPAFTPGQPDCLPTWSQVRLTSRDRLPIVGAVVGAAPGLYALTALGARGITLGVLCGELLAAQLHAEPLPLEAALAQQLGSGRLG
ncbi:MAG: FAD-dependent oxidoreductase, partial [Comamonas sp.]|nr:FAD-dependent oxidoreductase [Comamonas sp.]